MKRKYKIILTIAIILLIIIILYLPWLMMVKYYVFEHDTTQPSPPEITYGEFPIELIYEINGKTITVNDVYICKYNGYNDALNTRRWIGQMKSTGEYAVLLYHKGNEKIFCRIASPGFFMGEKGAQSAPPYTVIKEKNTLFSQSSGVIDENELYEQYKIKIVSWSFSDPIENTFE